MDKKHIEYFRKVLTDQLEELIRNADNTVLGMTAPKENFPDFTDLASFKTERDFMLRIRDRENKLIIKIKEALDRIENGTFTICEVCGENISLSRLLARPVATLCIDCKTKEEAAERAFCL